MAKTRETQSPNKIPTFVWAVALILAVLLLAIPFFGSKDSGNSRGTPQRQTTTSSGAGSVPATTQPTTTATEPGKGKLSIRILSEGTEDAVSGATVAISGAENLELLTGTLGEVEFYRITEGTYSVRVSANGFFGQEVSAQVSPETETELAIHLRKSAPEPEAPKEEEPLPNSGFSEVRVIEASSRAPIAGATVSLTDSRGRPVLTKETIGNGTALFNLPVGGYFATINAEGYYEKKANFVIYENSTVPVLVGMGKKI